MTNPKNGGEDSLTGKNESTALPVNGLYMQETSSLITPERLDGTNYIE